MASWISRVALAGSLLLAAAAGPQPGVKTVARTYDPLVLRGSQLPALVNSPLPRLSLMVARAGSWLPVPFQVDEKKPDNSYAFTSGRIASRDPDRNFDGNDELVFLARDLGDRAAAWPRGVTAGAEIEVQDPTDGGRGWAYLFKFSGNGPRSRTDYIQLQIDEKNGRRTGRSSELVVGAPLDRVYPDFIASTRPDGTLGKDVLDRLKIRGELRIPGNFQIPFNADDLIRARDLGYIDGPVRAMQLTDGYMQFSGIELAGFGHSTLIYYPNHVIVPITIKAGPQIPDWVINLLPDGRVAGYMDFNANVYGSHIFSPANGWKKDVVLDGRMSAAEQRLDTGKPIDWIAGAGPEGGLVVRLMLDSVATTNSTMSTYFIDDQNRKDPPEDNPGSCSVGFDIRGKGKGDIAKIARSSTFFLHFYGVRNLTPENVQVILDIVDHPLRVSVSAVNPQAGQLTPVSMQPEEP